MEFRDKKDLKMLLTISFIFIFVFVTTYFGQHAYESHHSGVSKRYLFLMKSNREVIGVMPFWEREVYSNFSSENILLTEINYY